MPLYDYRCECGEVREVLHGMSDISRVECLECGGVMSKCIGPSPLIFKGDGFYETDYKRVSGNGTRSSDHDSSATVSAF